MRWPKFKFGDLVEIVWTDITSTTAWVPLERAKNFKPIECVSIGYYLNEDKFVIRVSDTINSERERTVNVIIKGCINSIKKIKR